MSSSSSSCGQMAGCVEWVGLPTAKAADIANEGLLTLSPPSHLRYANNSNYKNDEIITREVFVNKAIIDEFKRIVIESDVGGLIHVFFAWGRRIGGSWHTHLDNAMRHAPSSPSCVPPHVPCAQVMKEDDNNWPMPDRVGRQELEVIVGSEHTSFTCTKLGSVLQVQQSKDPDGLKVFYYLVQVGEPERGRELCSLRL